MKKFIVVLVALLALVVFMPHNTVNAIEKTQIETLDYDLFNIINVDFEIVKTINPIMIVEVEISFENHYGGLQDNTNVYYTANYSYKANFNDLDNPIEEASRQYGNNYLTSLIWQYNYDLTSTHYTKSEQFIRYDWKFYNLYKEVGIVTGVIQGLQHIT